MQIDEYRKLAETEDHMWYFAALNQRILLPLSHWHGKDAQVLDAGCGTGGLIRALHKSEPQWSITGLDFSPVACSLARESTDADIVQGSITELPFSNNSFDILTCADVISQVSDATQALREFARVLRVGGLAVINVAAYRWMWSYHDETCETQHRFRRSELLKMVKTCGLQPVQSTYANMIIFPLIILRRKLFPPQSATSDVQAYPALLDKFCGTMASLEYSWLQRGGSLPTGCSVFLAARKV
jgi:ubiquinone/menaquinone biosynthesis C-methylase UbiE